MRINIFLCFLILISIAGLTGCNSDPVNISISGFMNPEQLKANLENSPAQPLPFNQVIVPMFEVDWDWQRNAPIPLNSKELQLEEAPFKVIPGVLITSRTLELTPPSEIGELAKRIAERITELTDSTPFQEIYLDHFWTKKSLPVYQELIQTLRIAFGEQNVQVAVQLPLRYFFFSDSVGIPVADRAYLSSYDELNLAQIFQTRELLQKDVIEPLLRPFSQYPIPVSILIPNGTWAMVTRSDSLIHVFPSVSQDEFQVRGGFKKGNEFLIQVQRDTYFRGEFLLKGDEIRIRNIQPQDFRETLRIIRPFIDKDSIELALPAYSEEMKGIFRKDSIHTWLNQ